MLVSGEQQNDSVIYILFHILFHFGLLQDIEYSSLWVGFWWVMWKGRSSHAYHVCLQREGCFRPGVRKWRQRGMKLETLGISSNISGEGLRVQQQRKPRRWFKRYFVDSITEHWQKWSPDKSKMIQNPVVRCLGDGHWVSALFTMKAEWCRGVSPSIFWKRYVLEKRK